VSQLALAVPMCLLYEIGIWSARMFVKKKPDEEPATEAGKA
jgi:sec-independent protein translocase protein TatC